LLTQGRKKKKGKWNGVGAREKTNDYEGATLSVTALPKKGRSDASARSLACRRAEVGPRRKDRRIGLWPGGGGVGRLRRELGGHLGLRVRVASRRNEERWNTKRYAGDPSNQIGPTPAV